MIRSDQQSTPLTIALFGDWGTGKTTVMGLLRRDLSLGTDLHGIVFADFNAWAYEHTDNMGAALAQEVKRGLTDVLSWWKKARLICRYSIARHNTKLLVAIGAAVLAVGSAALAVMQLDRTAASDALSAGLGAVAATGFVVFVTQAVSLGRVLFNHPFTSQFASYLALPSFDHHLGLSASLRRDLEDLCRLRLGGRTDKSSCRLVLFVDDLDRCSPRAIVEVLDAVRLVMDIPNVVVVMAMDPRVALRAIGDHYATLADEDRSKEAIARDYLGKIIQVPFRLFSPPQESVERFIREGLFNEKEGIPDAVPQVRQVERLMTETPQERDLFVALANGLQVTNPRQIRRLRNSYRLLKVLCSASDVAPEHLMRMLFWQDHIRTLRPAEFVAIEAALVNGDQAPEGIASSIWDPLQSLGEREYRRIAEIASQVVIPHGRRTTQEAHQKS